MFSIVTNSDRFISNLKPTKTDFKVEKLNDLIVRLINKYTGI